MLSRVGRRGRHTRSTPQQRLAITVLWPRAVWRLVTSVQGPRGKVVAASSRPWHRAVLCGYRRSTHPMRVQNRAQLGGSLLQTSTPDWEPLLAAVGVVIVESFMWMSEIRLSDGSKMQ